MATGSLAAGIRARRATAALAALVAGVLAGCVHDVGFVDHGRDGGGAADGAQTCREQTVGNVCDPWIPCGCAAGEACYQLTAVTRGCAVPGSLREADLCDLPTGCGAGLGCADYQCRRYCTAEECGADAVCTGAGDPGSTTGYCIGGPCDPLATTGGACPAGIGCIAQDVQVYRTGSVVSVTDCAAVLGTTPPGADCYSNGCPAGWRCMARQAAGPEWQCWRNCRVGHDEDCADSGIATPTCIGDTGTPVRGVRYGHCRAR